ncbi:MAG: CotH kinase family protein [Dehalococcoidales bacterium]|nr:CotH kinase family protein [Dehalococcoidales bacterium]
MRKKISILISAFLLVIIVAPSLSGCKVSPAAYSGDSKVNPFYTDRVATVRIVLPEDNWQSLMANAYSNEYFKADFWFDDELVPDVGVRAKGNASLQETVRWSSERFPLCIDFNLLNPERTFHGIRKVHFNNGWSDPTLIRDVLAYDIFAKMGVPSPRASIIDLYVNDHHLGVYTMAEAVDTALLARYFNNTTGNLYKPDVAAARLDWTEEDAYKPFAFFGMSTPEPPETDPVMEQNIGGGRFMDILKALDADDTVGALHSSDASATPAFLFGAMPRNLLEAMALKTNENNPDYTALFKFLDVLNNEPDETFPQEIEKVLDVDEALMFLAVSAGIVHLDNYIGIGHNTYLYEVNGKFSLIPWDLNMAFGTFNAGIRKDGIMNYYIDEPTSGPMNRFPLVDRLLSYPPYLEKYRGYLQELLDGPFSPDVILPRIDQLVEMIRPYAREDTEMFYSYEDWERCITEDLRPPDVFEGWQAGGPTPMMPWFLEFWETDRLRKNFGVRSLFELMGSFKESDIDKLRSTVAKETADLFLQNLYGPLMSPQPPGQSGFGPNCLGLKTFIVARWESVRQQLNGERQSGTGWGGGNGASMWMVDMFSPPE